MAYGSSVVKSVNLSWRMHVIHMQIGTGGIIGVELVVCGNVTVLILVKGVSKVEGCCCCWVLTVMASVGGVAS